MIRLLSFAPLLGLAPALSPHKHGPYTIPRGAPVDDAPNVVTPLLPAFWERAQADSKATLPGYNNSELYSGFFDIDSSTNSHTYFMFSKAVSGRADAPVLLWLNGGPGASSLLGFYDELGPFGITEDLKVEPREVHWALDCHLLALDNPLGVGYSHTDSADRMVTNQKQVGQDLYEALSQFFQLFPDLRDNAFYATGESYAGKYVPAVAYEIHQRNAMTTKASERINLKGIAVGDGAFDPPTQFTEFGPLLFNIGLADTRDVKVYEEYDRQFKAAVKNGDTVKAFRVFDEMLNGDYYPNTYYANTTGMGLNYFNYELEPGAASLTERTFPNWLTFTGITKALHVGGVRYSVFNQTVEDKLIPDWIRGVVPELQVLMDHYDVLIYNGQYDVILGPPGTERAIDKLVWSGASDYRDQPTLQFTTPTTPKRPGYLKSDLAGYYRQARSTVSDVTFSYVMLRGCGHMVPTDQPVRAYNMLRKFLVPMAPLPAR